MQTKKKVCKFVFQKISFSKFYERFFTLFRRKQNVELLDDTKTYEYEKLT